MSALESVYQEVILDHYKSPRNFGVLETANQSADGHNPLCGDQVSVYLEVEADRIKAISFKGAGCAISTASASLMTERLKGMTLREARQTFQAFHRLLTGDCQVDEEELGKLAAFQGVRKYPVRVKCATLAWHTLQAALECRKDKVATE